MKDDKHKRGEIPRHVQICEEENIKRKMEPKWITLESSMSVVDVEAPEQPHLVCREMHQTTIRRFTHDGGSLKQGGIISP